MRVELLVVYIRSKEITKPFFVEKNRLTDTGVRLETIFLQRVNKNNKKIPKSQKAI